MADFLFVMSYEMNSINLLVLPEVFFLFNFFFLFIRFVINNFFKNVMVSDYYNCFMLVLLGVLILKCCNGYFMLTWVDCSGMLFSDLKSVVYSFFFFFCLFLFSILARFFYKFEFLLVEFFFLVWICLIGLSFFFFVNDFILFFLLLELVSLSLYVLICFNFESVKAVEASLKYFVLGSIASMFYLYGVSFLYGFFGTTNFFQLSGLFYSFYFNGFLYKYFVFGCMGIVMGILFKLGLVPFHMWIIDVYKGLNFFSFFFFSIFTKLSFFFILMRLMFDVFFVFVYDLYMMFVYISIFSIVMGAVGALGSVSFRHVFTYTTMSNSGFVLLGMLNFTGKALMASSFYLFGYVLLLLLLCGCLIMVNMNKSNQFFESMEDFAYVSSLSPFVSYLLMGVFFSMAGLPPFLGFFMKFFLFLSFISFGSYFSFMMTFFLLMINVLNVFVYIRLISYLIFDVEKYNGFFMNDKFVYLMNVSISLLNVGVIIFFFFLSW